MTLRPVLLMIALLLAAGCGGDGQSRFCFGSDRFCDDAFGINDPPHADAGADIEAVSGDRVELDGTASDDPDGRIDSYSWTQRSGPVVALEDGDQALARFDAPEVTVETKLVFRLVVTDDDGASDHDEVSVTVLPIEIAALLSGLDRLKHVHNPLAGNPLQRPADTIGLWLAARVAAAEAGADPAVDVLLDELRTLEQMLAPVAGAAPPLEQTTLFRLGQAHVAAFTARRDPATAELAVRSAGSPRTVPLHEWGEALRETHPELGWFADGPAARRHAAALLTAAADPAAAADAAAKAAATAVLLLASPPDTPIHGP